MCKKIQYVTHLEKHKIQKMFEMNIFWTTGYTELMQPVGRRWHAGLYFVSPGRRFANIFCQALRIPLTRACMDPMPVLSHAH